MVIKKRGKSLIMIAMSLILFVVICFPFINSQDIIYVETNKEVYTPGETVKITANVTSNEPTVDLAYSFHVLKTPHKTLSSVYGEKILYKSEDKPLEIREGETTTCSASWDIPSNIEHGLYKIYFFIKSEQERLAFSGTFFNVSDEGQVTKSIELDRIEFEQDGEIGGGLEGFNVFPDKETIISSNLENTGDIGLNLTAELDVYYTFESEEKVLHKEKKLRLEKGESMPLEFLIDTPDKPTSYTPIITLFNSEGDIMGRIRGRLVVKGEGGSIMNAFTNQSAYLKDDKVEIYAEVIGPSDYSSTIENVELYYALIKNEEKILEGNKNIDLELNLKKINFTSTAPQDIEDYTLELELRKNGEVFDKYKKSYEGNNLLSVEDVKKERQGEQLDNETLEKESNKDEKETEGGGFIIVSIVVGILTLIVIILLIYMLIKYKNSEEKENIE